jgi:hypothetical protein
MATRIQEIRKLRDNGVGFRILHKRKSLIADELDINDPIVEVLVPDHQDARPVVPSHRVAQAKQKESSPPQSTAALGRAIDAGVTGILCICFFIYVIVHPEDVCIISFILIGLTVLLLCIALPLLAIGTAMATAVQIYDDITAKGPTDQ